MKATQKLHDLGQSLWLDNITRDILDNGTLKSYITELSVTGLTSNPTIFDQAIKKSALYDPAIHDGMARGLSGETLFFDLALDDLTRAADLFRPIHNQTKGVDGWVSLEVSPVLAYDTATTLAAAKDLSSRGGRPNLFIKIPGTKEGIPAIEESIFAGVPVNVTLLFSREQYLAAAEAYLRGIERRIAAGLPADIPSVASLFISRWDVAVASKVPATLVNKLGIAIGRRTYQAYADLIALWESRPENLPQKDQCHDHGGRFEIDRRFSVVVAKRCRERARHEARDQAVDICSAGADRDEREHVEAAIDDRGPAALEEWEAAPENHGRRQRELDPVNRAHGEEFLDGLAGDQVGHSKNNYRNR